MIETEKASEWIKSIIKDYINTSPDNTLVNEENDKAFDTPLIGFSNGADPIFDDFKDHVGPFYMTPWEVFSITFRGIDIKPEDLTVISWVLPHIKATKEDNQKEDFYPAERWARGRIYGEEVNVKLRKYVVSSFEAEGIKSIAPSLTPQFSMRLSQKYGFSSTWSERHAAYASGLGTFGLCDGLITSVGKAMRVGSVVANIRVPVTERPYTNHNEYCLFYTKGICGKCISKCPVGAITEKGKDKNLCVSHLYPTTSEYVTSKYGFKGYGCGHCQTGVPCESKIPTEEDV